MELDLEVASSSTSGSVDIQPDMYTAKGKANKKK